MIMDRGIRAIQAAIASVRSHHADGLVIVGTSVFRDAVNGKQYADRIQKETGVKVQIVDQELEGGLGFLAAAAHSRCGPQELIVWDIGGKTVQWSSKKANGCFHIAMNEQGSGYFRDHIITSIQGRRLEQFRTPNPISLQEANLTSAHAVCLADQLDPLIKSKMQTFGVQVVGVGSVFGRGILPWLGGNPHVTIQDLDKVVEGLIGLPDEALGGGDFACVEVSNALLVQGFMRHLKLDSIEILDVNLADGAMVYEPFWE